MRDSEAGKWQRKRGRQTLRQEADADADADARLPDDKWFAGAERDSISADTGAAFVTAATATATPGAAGDKTRVENVNRGSLGRRTRRYYYYVKELSVCILF